MKKTVDQAWLEEPWFDALKSKFKLTWFYIWTKSDLVGVWSGNRKIAEMQLGCAVEWEDFLKAVEDRVRVLPDGKWWLTQYCRFQFGDFSPDSRVHIAAKKALNGHGIFDSDTLWIPYPEAMGSLITSHSHSPRKKRVKGEGTAEHFAQFWSSYPRKENKAHSEEAWRNLGCDAMHQDVLDGLERYKLTAQWTRDNGEFVPHPTTWLNGKRWQDDPAKATNGAPVVIPVRSASEVYGP